MRTALLAGLCAAAACGPKAEAPREELNQVMEGLVLRQSEAGAPGWTLRSARATLREESRLTDLVEPSMEFYRKGKAVSRVTARVGQAHQDTREVRLSSGVVLDSYDDQSRLTTEDLTYAPDRDLFVTQADILVRRPEGVVRGRGMTAKPDLSEIRIFDQKSVYHGDAK